MPEKYLISFEEKEKIDGWVLSKPEGRVWARYNLGKWGSGSVVYAVADEPLVVDGGHDGFTLLCSDDHAKELKDAGIVNFRDSVQEARN